MARRIGCPLSTYVQWETGRATPRGDWLLRILDLSPDAETRAAFGISLGASQSEAKGRSDPFEGLRQNLEKIILSKNQQVIGKTEGFLHSMAEKAELMTARRTRRPSAIPRSK